MRPSVTLMLPFTALLLSGCLARTAIDVATLPVKVASKTVDAVTTSQSEADQKRGRDIRRREERLGQLEDSYGREARKCEAGNDRACRDAVRLRREIDVLLPTIPVERD
jgi:hypothetical protein